MYRGKTVAVVVPAYNEAAFVGDVIDAIPDYVDRIYAVDDCSTDGTWREILDSADAAGSETQSPVGPRETGAGQATGQGSSSDIRSDGGAAGGESRAVGRSSPTEQSGGGATTEGVQAGATPDAGEAHTGSRVVPIRHDVNRGVGGAIKTGYRHAIRDRIDLTAVIAGDGQMDPAILDAFLDPIVDGVAAYTKGNRLESPALHAEMSTWRRGGNRLLTLLTRIASGYWQVSDPQNGYTAISLDALETIDVESLYDRFGFSNDVLVRCNARDLRVADVPMAASYGDEQSHIRYSSFVPRLSALLFRDFCWRLSVTYCRTDFHPLVLLYALGAGGTLAGIGSGLWTLLGPGAAGAGGTLVVVLVSVSLLGLAMRLDRRQSAHLDRSVAD
jgi:glycosyltransferase involved in cell wall biosynthesis